MRLATQESRWCQRLLVRDASQLRPWPVATVAKGRSDLGTQSVVSFKSHRRCPPVCLAHYSLGCVLSCLDTRSVRHGTAERSKEQETAMFKYKAGKDSGEGRRVRCRQGSSTALPWGSKCSVHVLVPATISIIIQQMDII